MKSVVQVGSQTIIHNENGVVSMAMEVIPTPQEEHPAQPTVIYVSIAREWAIFQETLQ